MNSAVFKRDAIKFHMSEARVLLITISIQISILNTVDLFYHSYRRNIEVKMPNTQRVYIGGLANDARERDVEKFFKGYGKFGEVSMKQGYGFVDFEDYRDADDAVHDLNGKDLLGERY